MDNKEFFERVFGTGKGRAVIVLPDAQGRPVNDKWFSYPEDVDHMVAYVEAHNRGSVWYSPVLFKSDQRTKDNSLQVSIAGADADACDPTNFRVQPSISIETSPGRWQVYWQLNKPQDANEVAKLNRRIAQVHKDEGCDIAFVNAAKLMRVPGTSNHKHPGAVVVVGDYDLQSTKHTLNNLSKIYPASEVPDAISVANTEMPDDIAAYISENRMTLLTGLPNSNNLRELLFGQHASDKRSDVRFKLLCELYRIGLDDYGVMAIAWGAPSNKYNGDDARGYGGLWAEAMKAKAQVESEAEGLYDTPVGSDPLEVVSERPVVRGQRAERTNFLTEDELKLVADKNTFIDDWVAWSATKTDAPAAYHETAAMSLLSTVYSQFGYVLPSFGKVKLNLWFMMLGRSTKDRKSTAKGYAERMLHQISTDDFDYILPDDSTPGGLNVALADRANLSSIIMRDEAQGFFEEMANQSYMSGGISYFTKLYDGWSGGRARASGDKKIQKSVPISFVFYMLGILSDSAEVLTVRNYKQGFLTRFVYVIAARPDDWVEPQFEFADDQDTEETDEVFNALANRLVIGRNHWEMITPDGGLTKVGVAPGVQQRFQEFRDSVLKLAAESTFADVIESTSDRMALSTLKLAALLAMDDRKTHIELIHLLKAISYSGAWFDSSVEVASLISESEWQRDVDKLEAFINTKGGRVAYATAYKAFKEKRPFEFEEMITSLESRGVLKRVQQGARWVLEVSYSD